MRFETDACHEINAKIGKKFISKDFYSESISIISILIILFITYVKFILYEYLHAFLMMMNR